MSGKFEMVKNYLLDLDLKIVKEEPAEELVIVEDEENGIRNMVIDCEEPIVILEQVIMPVPRAPGDFYKRLLQLNRSLVHGAFVLDEESKYLIYRDTLQLENLDMNELEASIQALSLALAENSNELLEYAKK
jgi:hypothetical protein